MILFCKANSTLSVVFWCLNEFSSGFNRFLFVLISFLKKDDTRDFVVKVFLLLVRIFEFDDIV